ncbi:MAG: hypothetical protein GX897_01610 [Clostridiales bacterium]|nr:hypothetical protein [Clostridiales bacterium]
MNRKSDNKKTDDGRKSSGLSFKRHEFMGLNFVAAGFCFLFNPLIGMNDFLPDFIGWLLILYGLGCLSDLSEDLAFASKQARRLLYIGIVRIALMIILPSLEDKGLSLVFTFLSAVFETGLMVLFFGGFFKGMSYLSIRHGGDSVLKNLNRVKTASAVFAVMRGAFNLLPELKYLSTSQYEGEITAYGTFDLANYPTALLVINLVFAGAAGIIWLSLIILWMRQVMADKAFLRSLQTSYSQTVSSDSMLLERRRINRALIALGIGFGLWTDIFLDGINYIPDFIGTIFIIAGLLIASKELAGSKRALKLTYILLPINIVVWALSLFASKYYTLNMFRSFNTLYLLCALIAAAAAEAGVAGILLLHVSKALRQLIYEKCGELDDERFSRLTERKKKMQAGLYRTLVFFVVSGLITQLSSVLNYFGLYASDWYWLINAGLQIVNIFAVVWIFSGIYEQINIRFDNVRRG